MNVSIIRYILGNIIKLEGFFMLLPCVFALIFHEKELFTYLAVAVGCILLGSLLTLKKAKDTVFYLKEGCIATVLSWVCLSFFGSLPFMLTGEIPHFTDALFETVSGFTTTGASILSNVEALSHTSLFWRSFTHWIGGMGVLVFLLAIVPLSGGSNMNLMRAESPGPSVGKLVPKMRYTARILYIIYFVLTILELIALLLVKMPWFDAVCISIGTAGTGGFGILNSSCGAYSVAAQWIITIFMILFSINFNAFYLILFGQIKNALKMEEVRAFLLIVVAVAGERFLLRYYESFGYRRLSIRNQGKHSDLKRVVVYGGGLGCRLYINQLYCGRHSEGVNIVGIIDDNPALSRLNVYGFDVLGTLRRLEAIYQKTPFEEIIITCNDISNGKIRRLREFQKKNNVRLVAFVRELKEFSE